MPGSRPASGGDSNEIKGFAASSGVVEGPARVVKSVEEISRLKQGDILVCQVTNPTWAPIFQKIAAAVSDIGGSMSHAAIVAREYGLPAVVGTGNATSRIKDGQRIRVDGGRGVVTILRLNSWRSGDNRSAGSRTSASPTGRRRRQGRQPGRAHACRHRGAAGLRRQDRGLRAIHSRARERDARCARASRRSSRTISTAITACSSELRARVLRSRLPPRTDGELTGGAWPRLCERAGAATGGRALFRDHRRRQRRELRRTAGHVPVGR